MPLMLHVINVDCCLWLAGLRRGLAIICSVILVVGAASPRAEEVIDLTRPTPKGQVLLSVPGASVGSVEGAGRMPPLYTLPLKVKLRAVRPRSVGAEQDFVVEATLTNVGAAPFALPISQEHVTVQAAGNRGRRMFAFHLRFWDAKKRREEMGTFAVTSAADNIAGSVREIPPKGSVSVVFRANPIPVIAWVREGTRRFRVRVAVSESRLEDERFFLKDWSEEVFSPEETEIVVE